MCHIHTLEHSSCMTKNPLMVLRCIDSFKTYNSELHDYLLKNEIVIITNSQDIGECVFIRKGDNYILLDEIDEFFITFANSGSKVYKRILLDDSFGWNIHGLGLINFCTKYSTYSQNAIYSNNYFWDIEDWSIQKLISSLNETETILHNNISNNKLSSILINNKFNMYRILYNDSLEFIKLN